MATTGEKNRRTRLEVSGWNGGRMMEDRRDGGNGGRTETGGVVVLCGARKGQLDSLQAAAAAEHDRTLHSHTQSGTQMEAWISLFGCQPARRFARVRRYQPHFVHTKKATTQKPKYSTFHASTAEREGKK